MRIKKTYKLFVALVGIFAISCSSSKDAIVKSNPEKDFSQYKTFAWLQESDSTLETDIVRNNAKNFVIHCMSKRGLVIDKKTPDLLFKLNVIGKKDKDVFTTPVTHYSPDYYVKNPYYYPYYYKNWTDYTYDFKGKETIEVNHVVETVDKIEETIILQVFERKTKQEIWSAEVKGYIYDKQYLTHDVHPGMHQLMKKFPVKPLKTLKKKKRFSKYLAPVSIYIP